MYQIDQMQPKHQVSGLESYRFITSFHQRPLFWVSVCLKVVAGTAQQILGFSWESKFTLVCNLRVAVTAKIITVCSTTGSLVSVY